MTLASKIRRLVDMPPGPTAARLRAEIEAEQQRETHEQVREYARQGRIGARALLEVRTLEAQQQRKEH